MQLKIFPAAVFCDTEKTHCFWRDEDLGANKNQWKCQWTLTGRNNRLSNSKHDGNALFTPASFLAIALRIFFNHFLKTEHITKGRILPQSICSSKVRWAWDFLRLISSREPRASGWIMIHCWWIEVTKLRRSLPAPQRNMHSKKNKFLFPQRICCNIFVSTCSKLH